MEIKIPAFPVLEPLSKATQTNLAPADFDDTDFLEIDVETVDKDGIIKQHFVVQAVCLKKCEGNLLPSVDDAANPDFVQTEYGTYYKDDRRYYYPSFEASSLWFKRIPEAGQISYGKWKLAGTDYSALVIHHLWDHHKLIFQSEEAALLYTYLLRRFFSQSFAAKTAAEFKTNHTVPPMPEDFIEHESLPLADYQKVAMICAMQSSSYALFMEQGTGKTPIVIAKTNLESARKRAEYKKAEKKGGMYRTLILCPQQCRLNWEREFQRFAVVPGKTVVLRGGPLRKVRGLCDAIRDEDDCAWSATILSIDSVDSMWEALKGVVWDQVVIDESHKIKNWRTNRYKTLIKIDEVHAKHKMILTGTPITNTPFDLWAQFEWLSPGLSGFSTYANFRSFHGKWKESMENGSAVAKLVGFKNVPLIQERLARLSFLLTKKDSGLNLPDKVYDLYEVAMLPQQAEIYKQVATKLVAEIDKLIENSTNSNLTVEHILTKLIRLAQICSGFVKLDDTIDLDAETRTRGKTVQISSKNPKVDAVVAMIKEDWENDKNSKCIIWACFIPDVAAISKRLIEEGMNLVGYHKAIPSDYRVKNAQEAEDKMNLEDDCRILLGNPESAGVGQNFLGYDKDHPERSSMYINHHIYFSCNWSAVDRIQSEDRSHRRGTRTNLRITDLVVPYTIDDEIRQRVAAKRDMAMGIQDIRNILSNVLSGYGGGK